MENFLDNLGLNTYNVAFGENMEMLLLIKGT